MSDVVIVSPNGLSMLEELPEFYEPIRETRALLQAEGLQFDALDSALYEALDQSFIDTATWKLQEWEREFGVEPDAGKPLDQRRAVVKSKIRGFGKFSAALLKNVAEAYDRGSVDVSFDPARAEFTIRFIDTMGTPPNLPDLQAAIEEVLPAHLVAAYAYRYLMLAEVEAMTLEQVENLTMDKISWG